MMSSPADLIRAGMYCIIANAIAFVLAIAESYILDPMVDAMTKAGMLNVSSFWATATNTDPLIFLAYLIPYLISFIGILYFIIIAVKRQRYDIYGQPINEYDLRW